jgi:hypothetical protein
MDVEKIRQMRLASPFRQFEILLRDGRRLFVDQPYHLGIAPDGSRLLFTASRDVVDFTADQVASLNMQQRAAG